jgi:predicted aconitase
MGGEGTRENWQSIEYGNIRHTRRKKNKVKQKHDTICVGHPYAQANTYNLNKTRTEHRFNAEIVTDIITRNSEHKHTY